MCLVVVVAFTALVALVVFVFGCASGVGCGLCVLILGGALSALLYFLVFYNYITICEVKYVTCSQTDIYYYKQMTKP